MCSSDLTHRPEICYPAQGFRIDRGSVRGRVMFGSAPIDVTRLVAAQGTRNEPITYWLIVGDRITHFGQAHKLVSLRYGVLGQIPDGMLVRVSSIDLDSGNAFAFQQDFIVSMLNAVSAPKRNLVLGNLLSPS